MPTTLREHAAARKAVQLTPCDIATFEQGLQFTYEAIAADCWGSRTPPDDEYVSVVIDQLQAHGRLTPDEFAKFSLLPWATKRYLALNVGP